MCPPACERKREGSNHFSKDTQNEYRGCCMASGEWCRLESWTVSDVAVPGLWCREPPRTSFGNWPWCPTCPARSSTPLSSSRCCHRFQRAEQRSTVSTCELWTLAQISSRYACSCVCFPKSTLSILAVWRARLSHLGQLRQNGERWMLLCTPVPTKGTTFKFMTSMSS